MLHRQSLCTYCAPLEPTSVALPEPSGTQVRLTISSSGVCHSDLHLIDGYFDLGAGEQLDVTGGRTLPFTLGHEIAGVIDAVGPDAAADLDAANLNYGSRVAAFPWIGCGACPLCARGDEHLCNRPQALGITVDGGYATHVLVPHPRYLLDIGGLDDGFAAALMCSGLTAYSALRKALQPPRPGPLLLVGLGGVGMMGLAFARAMQDAPVFASDIDAAKRDAALAAGATQVFDPRDRDTAKALFKASQGGVGAVIDFVGTEASFQFANRAVAKGGVIVLVGLMGGRLDMPLPMVPMRNLTITGSYVGSLEDARGMLQLVRKANIQPVALESRPLQEANAALDDLRAGRVVGRVILKP
ncbi:MAG: alcohol dehydrogenase catalytic domain-containing protein [Pseudomonadota bacterium]